MKQAGSSYVWPSGGVVELQLKMSSDVLVRLMYK